MTDAPKRKQRGGWKKSALPPELAELLGPAPLGQPLKLARWFTDAIALLTQLVMEGKPFKDMLETVRASAGAAGRVLPHDIIFVAGQRLDRDARDLGEHQGGGKVTTRKDDDVAQRARAVRRDPT